MAAKKKMANAPVYFVILQVKFNSIFDLDTFAPKIQDRFRRQGFPDAKRLALNTINLAGFKEDKDSEINRIPMELRSRYTFWDMASTTGFMLDQDALSLLTTEYDTFESFRKIFLTGLEATHEIVELSYTELSGLRYLDAVVPKDDEPLTKYLTEAVCGVAGRLGGEVDHVFSESALLRDGMKIISRAITQTGGIGFPPDLNPFGLKIAERFAHVAKYHAILDTDVSINDREPINFDSLESKLKRIHDQAYEAFAANVTEAALKAWQ